MSEIGMRTDKGLACLTEAWGREPQGEDVNCAASDAIADVLTALFGAAGYCEQGEDGWHVRLNEERVAEARHMALRGFESWLGDAEDYEQEDVEDYPGVAWREDEAA